LGVKRKASPAEAPGRVTARMARITTSTMREGMRIRAAVSIPFTPRETTKSASPMAMTWVRTAPLEPAKASQKAPGGSEGTSPITVATKKRMVHPITTL
jgi:hypothetical protein